MSDNEQLESLRAFAERERGYHVEHCQSIPVVSGWFLEVDKDGRVTGNVISENCTTHVQWDPKYTAVCQHDRVFYNSMLTEWLNLVDKFHRQTLQHWQSYNKLNEVLQDAVDCTPETHNQAWRKVWECIGWNPDTQLERYLQRKHLRQQSLFDDVVGLVGQQVAEAIRKEESTEQPEPQPEPEPGHLQAMIEAQAETIGRLNSEIHGRNMEIAELQAQVNFLKGRELTLGTRLQEEKAVTAKRLKQIEELQRKVHYRQQLSD